MEKVNIKSPDSMVRFLEADDYRFGTGYLKEYCWRHLKRHELTDRQKNRLQAVALQYLHQRMRREFWYMCRFIRLIVNDNFRQQIIQLINSPDAAISKRALLLNEYFKSAEAGERLRKKFHYECLDLKYRKHLGSSHT